MLADPERAPGPDHDARGGPSRYWSRGHRLTVGVLNGLYVAVALLGALDAGLVVILLVVPLTGLLGAVIARGVHRALHPGVETPLALHLPAAVATGLFLPFVTGMELLGENSMYVFLALVSLCAVAAVGWADALEPDAVPGRPIPQPRLPDAELSSLRDLCRALPVDELLHEWRWTSGQLRTAPHVAVQLRELLLEEMQRRNPAGFEAWLADGLDRDPEPHIRDDGLGGTAPDRPGGPGP